MAKKNAPPLVIEELQDRANYMYLTLLEYKRKQHLCIIDNVTDNEISAYILDFAKAEDIDVDELLRTVTLWYYKSSEDYPLSFEFAKLGMSQKMSLIRRTFRKDYISRFIGQKFGFNVNAKPKVRRKRVNPVPAGVEVKLKKQS
jgi:hypothetical protein